MTVAKTFEDWHAFKLRRTPDARMVHFTDVYAEAKRQAASVVWTTGTQTALTKITFTDGSVLEVNKVDGTIREIQP